jgi:hypothetical protein
MHSLRNRSAGRGAAAIAPLTVGRVFYAGIALIFYFWYAVFAVAGLLLIVFGLRAMQRPGAAGRARLVAGIVLMLIPTLMIASSYLPGQH